MSLMISRNCRSIRRWLDISSRLLPTSSNSSSLTLMMHQPKRGMKKWQEKTMREMYWRKKSFDALPEKVSPRSEYFEWNYSSELFSFAHRLHEPQLTEALLRRVFTHASYVSAQRAKAEQLDLPAPQVEDNRELITAGLEAMTNFLPLYLRYFLPKAPEECIQMVVKYLMSNQVLADVAKWIGCIDLVQCEEFPPCESTLADTVPALIGAIASESSLGRAHAFLIDFHLTYLHGADILEIWPLHQLDLNLDAYLKKHSLGGPTEPRLLFQSAVGTLEACHVVGVYVDRKLIGQSPGETPAIAKRMAQLDAFRRLFGLTTAEIRFRYGQEAYNLDYDKCRQPNPSVFQ